MYPNSPTIFNVPEITTLRRVKPLPKRRRTSAQESSPLSSISMPTNPPVLAVPSPPSAAAAAAAAVVASTGSLINDPDLEAAANALLLPTPQSLAQAPSPLSPSPSLLPLSVRTRSNSPRLFAPSQTLSLPPLGGVVNANMDPGDNGSLTGLDSVGGDHNHHLSQLPLPDPPNGDATAEELLAHADTLSARMALQSYYMPMLGSVHEFLAAAAASAGISAGEIFKDRLGAGDSVSQYVDLESTMASAEFLYGGTGYQGTNGLANMGFGIEGMSIGAGTSLLKGRDNDDDGHGDGDYVDHLQQPGNTKKRKVPANVVSQREDADSSDHSQDESDERRIPFGRVVDGDDSETSSVERGYSSGFGYLHSNHGYSQVSPHASMVPTLYHGTRRGKLTAATLAGLQHKEMLKSRKRQLAAVLGALSHGDTLALDQALSVNYPFEDIKNANAGADLLKVRLSKRSVVRMGRLAKMKENQTPNTHQNTLTKGGSKKKQKFPAGDFTFMCPSATADRLITTKEEVVMLRSRFEAELARQTAKAEQLVAGTAKAGSDNDHPSSRRPLAPVAPTSQLPSMARAAVATPVKGSSKGKKGRTKPAKSAPVEQQAQPPPIPIAPQQQQQQPTTGAPTKPRGKKKKRSALANASNPHHLRNYVPSRLPQSSSTLASQQQHQQQQNWISPPPVRFLSAEIPPRRRRQKNGEPIIQPTTHAPLTDPADEWICAFCEYDLFYGDDVRFRRAVRNRKKILRRRRRARERAAAAASGKGASGNVSTNPGIAAANMQPMAAQPAAPTLVDQNASASADGSYETSGPPVVMDGG